MRRSQLRRRREEGLETGGYFICNGLERVIRLLVQQRRHYPMALRRGAYAKRGPGFTDAATLLRCCSPPRMRAEVARMHAAVCACMQLCSHACTRASLMHA